MRTITRIIGVLVIIGVIAGLAAGSGAQTPAPYVRVFVNSQPVYFDVPPVIMSGRVLVPLRGVFERLGAMVAWDAATQTVLAQRGETSVALRIGNPQAQIDGQPALMDVPAMLVGGRTVVPLRFVSQALGAEVSWDAGTSTVQIFSQAAFPATPPASTLPPSQTFPPSPTTTTVTGTVLRVDSAVFPGQLMVQAGSATYTYQIGSATVVTRTNVSTNAGGPVPLSAVKPGDEVQVTADQSGNAQVVQAMFREISGQVSAATSDSIVLANGMTFRLNPSAQVVRGGVAINPQMLLPGDMVTLRLNPQTNEVWAATATRPAPSARITSVTVTPSGRQLASGEVVTVAAAGPPGGRATFSIFGLRSGLPMNESQSGIYIGTYVVQPGDVSLGAAVTVELATPDGQILRATSPTLVAINAAAPPVAGSSPVITSPGDGSAIGVPFTVTGRAAPGTLVKVSADYTGNILFFNVNGSLGSQVVVADQNGTWSATFTQEPSVRGVTVKITAVAVDSSGQARSTATSVTTTLN